MEFNSVTGTKFGLAVAVLAAATSVTIGALGIHSVAPFSVMPSGLKVALIPMGSMAGVLTLILAPEIIQNQIDHKLHEDAIIRKISLVNEIFKYS